MHHGNALPRSLGIAAKTTQAHPDWILIDIASHKFNCQWERNIPWVMRCNDLGSQFRSRWPLHRNPWSK
jgi:hypothetical protein